jgi:hypothetical protein
LWKLTFSIPAAFARNLLEGDVARSARLGFSVRYDVGHAENSSGTMMFGAVGNPDHDDSIRIIHRAVDAGINFIDTADEGEVRQSRGRPYRGRRSHGWSAA